jgi:hypothetical protein
LTVNVTVIVCAWPTDGVMTTVAVYVPLASPVVLTSKGIVEVAPALLLPLVRPSDSQACEGGLADHFSPSPPVLVNMRDRDDGLIPPAFAVYDSVFVLTCIAGGATLMVILTVTGLPETTLPVSGSVARMVTLVVKVDPPATPVASTITPTEVLPPPPKFVPALVERETKAGTSVPRVAVQLSASLPVLLMLIGWDVVPVVTLIDNAPGLTVRTGGASTSSATATVCGLPLMVTPLALTAASEIEPL